MICDDQREVRETESGSAYFVLTHTDDMSTCRHTVWGVPDADELGMRRQ